MKKFWIKTIAFLVCIYLGAHAEDFVNPLRGSITTHDPCIIKSDTIYHVLYTGNFIQHVTSTTRTQWTNAGSTIADPGWFKTYVPGNNGSDVWAPDISFRNGKFRLYYAVSTFGSNTSAIGLATSPSLTNAQWTDQGVVIASQSGSVYNCIDPNAFYDSDGTSWLSFGSFWNGINLVELKPATGKPIDSPAVITVLANHSGGIEASFLFKRGSYYYLFVSWDKCCSGVSSTYNIRYGRSTAVKGPYLDSTGTPMKSGGGTLLWSGDGRWKGPGAQNVFVDHDTTFLVCHAYDANAQGAVTLIIRPLYWTAGQWPTLTPTGIVNPTEIALRAEGSTDKRHNATATLLIAGARFVAPSHFQSPHTLCTVYDCHGVVVRTSMSTAHPMDLTGNGHRAPGIRIVQFIKRDD